MREEDEGTVCSVKLASDRCQIRAQDTVKISPRKKSCMIESWASLEMGEGLTVDVGTLLGTARSAYHSLPANFPALIPAFQ